LNIEVIFDTFHLSGKTLVAIDLLKRRDSGFAKAVAHFFKIIDGMPLGPERLSHPNPAKPSRPHLK
jgi:hypothetical protein